MYKIMKKYNIQILIVGLFIYCNTCFTQDTIRIGGCVKSRKTGIPIPYASVYIKHSSIGTITNEEGAFILTLQKFDKTDTLVISSMGFKKDEIFYKKVDIDNEQANYYLKEQVFEIDEVIIKPLSAEEIIKLAQKNMKHNYPVTPYGLEGFFRTTFKENSKYSLLLEASVYIYDKGFNRWNGQVVDYTNLRRSNDYRKFKLITSDEFLEGSLAFDRVRHKKDFMNNESSWTFEIEQITQYEDNKVYVIDAIKNLTEITTGAPYTYKAKIYVRADDYAILEVDYEMDFKRTNAKQFPLITETDSTRVKYDFCKMKYKYQDYKNLAYLKYIKWEIGYRIYDNRTNKLLTKDEIREETIIHDIDTKNPKMLRRSQKLGNLYNNVGYYDKRYWDNYNKPVDTQLIREVRSDLNKHENIEKQFIENSK